MDDALPIMKTAGDKDRSTDISDQYADMAKAFGGYGEHITEPGEIIPAIKRGIAKTREGTPVLLEFITEKEINFSIFKEPPLPSHPLPSGERVGRGGGATDRGPGAVTTERLAPPSPELALPTPVLLPPP